MCEIEDTAVGPFVDFPFEFELEVFEFFVGINQVTTVFSTSFATT